MKLLHTGKLPTNLGYFQSAVERFWRQVDKSGACWLWTGAKSGPNKSGRYYGQFTVAVDGKQISARAHRVAWMLLNGAIPPGQIIRHTCDNTECVNPAHLAPGTQYDNVVDCVSRLRHTIGERNRHAKLTADDVMAIRRSDKPTRYWVNRFGVHPSTITSIRNGSKWKHLPLTGNTEQSDE